MLANEFTALLQNCSKEPIQFLGETQSFAVFFAFESKNLTLTALSSNVTQLGIKPEDSLENRIDAIFDDESVQNIKIFLHHSSSIKKQEIKLSLRNSAQNLQFIAHTSHEYLILEHELKLTHEPIPMLSFLEETKKLAALDHYAELESIYHQTCKSIKKITGFDRVMIYKFHPDQHGEVVGEAKNNQLESYLGLHYPESDIPPQARDLYQKNLSRIIFDTESPRIKIISKKIETTKIDLSHSISRHVSKIHVQYLQNMKVRSSLSVSIMVDGKLWGLISCHHHSPKYLPWTDQAHLILVSQIFSSKLQYKESLNKEIQLQKSYELIAILSEAVSQEEDIDFQKIHELFKKNQSDVLNLVQANSFYFEIGGQHFSLGEIPSQNLVKKIKALLPEHKRPVYHSNQLFKDLALSTEEASPNFSGVLCLGTGKASQGSFIAWFRPEYKREIAWAGNKLESLKVKIDDQYQLYPRASFKKFVEFVELQSKLWSKLDIEVALHFLWFLGKTLISELNRAEKRIEELLDESKQKNKFISTLSHELRTPLTNILGWIELESGRLSANKETHELFEIIEKNAKQQLNLVNDLLDTTKLSEKKVSLSLKPTCVQDLLKQNLVNFNPSFLSQFIEVSLKSPEEKIFIQSDQGRLNQVFRNIIHNSLKFTPKGGKISILVQKDLNHCSISFTDSGVGISKDNLSKIFDLYFQAEKSASSNLGIGLGLSLCKYLVELHGGKISASSVGIGEGTTITVLLPLDQDRNVIPNYKTELRKKIQTNSLALKGKSFLLVEDTIESARFTKIFLNRNSASVEWAKNSKEALQKINDHEKAFDLILTDIGLPDLNGYELIKKIKDFEKYKKVPVISLSAYGQESDVKQSYDSGATLHLVKPVNLQELLETIQTLVNHEQ